MDSANELRTDKARAGNRVELDRHFRLECNISRRFTGVNANCGRGVPHDRIQAPLGTVFRSSVCSLLSWPRETHDVGTEPDRRRPRSTRPGGHGTTADRLPCSRGKLTSEERAPLLAATHARPIDNFSTGVGETVSFAKHARLRPHAVGPKQLNSRSTARPRNRGLPSPGQFRSQTITAPTQHEEA